MRLLLKRRSLARRAHMRASLSDRPIAYGLVLNGCKDVLSKHGAMGAPCLTAEENTLWLDQMFEGYRQIWGSSTLRYWWKKRGELDTLNLWLLELAAVMSVDFVTMAEFREEHRQPVFWDTERVEPKAKSKTLLQSIFGQLCNYNRGMFLVAKKGLDLQLLALFRAHVELGQQALLLAFDRQFFADYLEWFDLADDSDRHARYQHWKAAMSPARVRERLDACLRTTQLERSTTDELARYHRSTYGWLSEHHHGHPLALVVRTYGTEGLKFGGRADADTVEVLRKITYFNFELFSLLESAFGPIQRWSMDPRKEFCVEFMFKWRALRSISLELMSAEEKVIADRGKGDARTPGDDAG